MRCNVIERCENMLYTYKHRNYNVYIFFIYNEMHFYAKKTNKYDYFVKGRLYY